MSNFKNELEIRESVTYSSHTYAQAEWQKMCIDLLAILDSERALLSEIHSMCYWSDRATQEEIRSPIDVTPEYIQYAAKAHKAYKALSERARLWIETEWIETEPKEVDSQ